MMAITLMYCQWSQKLMLSISVPERGWWKKESWSLCSKPSPRCTSSSSSTTQLLSSLMPFIIIHMHSTYDSLALLQFHADGLKFLKETEEPNKYDFLQVPEQRIFLCDIQPFLWKLNSSKFEKSRQSTIILGRFSSIRLVIFLLVIDLGARLVCRLRREIKIGWTYFCLRFQPDRGSPETLSSWVK